MHVKEVLTNSGKKIKVYDDMFTMAQRQAIYSFCKNSFFKMVGVDSDLIEHQSNVTMMARFTEEDIKQMGFFQFVDEEVKTALKDHRLNAALVNLSTPADMHYVHTDTHKNPGITLLYYVNMRWPIEWAGETIFLNEEATDFEFVSPYKPGRLIVFDGSIPHIIRPPVMKADTLRMTFALRFVRD